MDKRKGYVLLLINASVRSSVSERKKCKRAFRVLLLELGHFGLWIRLIKLSTDIEHTCTVYLEKDIHLNKFIVNKNIFTCRSSSTSQMQAGNRVTFIIGYELTHFWRFIQCLIDNEQLYDGGDPELFFCSSLKWYFLSRYLLVLKMHCKLNITSNP